jgi:hypothetical protein
LVEHYGVKNVANEGKREYWDGSVNIAENNTMDAFLGKNCVMKW